MAVSTSFSFRFVPVSPIYSLRRVLGRRRSRPREPLLPPSFSRPNHPPLARIRIYPLCTCHGHSSCIPTQPTHLPSARWTRTGKERSTDEKCDGGGLERGGGGREEEGAQHCDGWSRDYDHERGCRHGRRCKARRSRSRKRESMGRQGEELDTVWVRCRRGGGEVVGGIWREDDRPVGTHVRWAHANNFFPSTERRRCAQCH